MLRLSDYERKGFLMRDLDQLIDKTSEEIKEMLTSKSKSKGYCTDDIDLYVITGKDHAIGEMILKAIRFKKHGNREDLIKSMAYCILLLSYECNYE